MGRLKLKLQFNCAQRIVFACALLALATAPARTEPAAPGRGEFEICQSCHGVSGQGNQSLNAPRIAGLDAGYLARQLINFRQGRRGADPADVTGIQMATMAATLADEAAVNRVAGYVAALPEVAAASTVTGDRDKGHALFATCSACHGQHAEGGASPGAPRLAGMSDWYLLRQLEAYSAGRRGTDASDTAGAAMRAMVSTLPDDAALHDVIAYIASLGGAVPVTAAPVTNKHSSINLRDACPPSFENAGGRCRLVSLYQFYSASPGQGGMRVPLPPLHDGFTPAVADLGRYLFFDPLLSADGQISCAHCHHPQLGFADGRQTSIGKGGRGVGKGRSGGSNLRRAAPSLWNVGFLNRLFWDGRADSLQSQARGPLFAADEMGNTPAGLAQTLAATPAYRRLFAQAFSRQESVPITVKEVVDALAAFESSLISINSRYDRYAQGDAAALTTQETRGYNVFRGFVARCSQCHVPPLFSSSDVAVVGAPPNAGRSYDLGVGELSSAPGSRGAFKISTLRNIAITAPYFQAGQFSTLDDVVAFYNDLSGHAVPPGAKLQIHWHVHMKQPELSAGDAADLVAFLGSLTDESLCPDIPSTVPSGLPVVASLTHTSMRKP